MEVKSKEIMVNMFSGVGSSERCIDLLGWSGPSFPFLLEKEIFDMPRSLKNLFLDKYDNGELYRLQNFSVFVLRSMDSELKMLIEQHLLKTLLPDFFN